MRSSSVLAPVARLLVAALGAAACSSGPSAWEQSCAQVESPLKICPGTPVLQGIDVSVYQGSIAWPAVKAAGIAFAFARISDGTTVPDSQFAINWRGMKKAGVLRGAYQYFRAGEDPAAQAALVATSLNAAGGLLPGDLPVVMDIETADGQSNGAVQAHMTTWLAAVARATGRTPIIYTNAATTSIIGAGFGAYPLWVANWATSCPSMPAGWSKWAFWQYSDTGQVPGVPAAVDLDEFDGTLSELTAFAAGGVADSGAEAGRVVDGSPDDAASAEGSTGDAARDASSKAPAEASALDGVGGVDASTVAPRCRP